MKSIMLIVICSLLTMCSIQAYGAPEDQVSNGGKVFGVVIPPSVPLPLHKTSVNFLNKYHPIIRVNFSWAYIEKEKGVYKLSSRLRALRRLAQETHSKFNVVLAYNNPLYISCRESSSRECRTQGVITSENIRAFENYVKFLMLELDSEVESWEIWNEQNAVTFWKPGPKLNGDGSDFKDFMYFLEKISKLIKQEDPTAYVISGGTAAVDFDFINTIFETGTFKYLDAIGIHMNMHTPGMIRYVENNNRQNGKIRATMPLDAAIVKLDSLYRKWGKPFAVTEFGFPLHSDYYPVPHIKALKGHGQIAFVQALKLLDAHLSIDRVFVYSLEDSVKPDSGKYSSRRDRDKKRKVNIIGGLRGLIDAYGHEKPVVEMISQQMLLFGQ